MGRKLIKSGATQRLWGDCLELESYIRSNTAHGIYKLDKEVLKQLCLERHPTLASSVILNSLNG